MSKNIHAVIVNVGSPASPSRHNVKRFLKSYLMDRYVMQMPWLFRYALVNWSILPTRSRNAAKRYHKIWSEAGSPIIYNTERLVKKIDEKLILKSSEATVSYAMRHGDNSIEREFGLLSKLDVEEILVIPQYPQYEKSTYLSCIEESKRVAAKLGLKVRFTPPFFDHGDYISALERSMREALTGNPVDRVLYSFHSVPLKYLPCGSKAAVTCDMKELKDCCTTCYKHQCYTTAAFVSKNLGIDEEDYSVVFQSKMGNKWLSPTLNATLSDMPDKGIKSVAVVAPSFTADCLETLEEVNIRGRQVFMNSGGREFRYVSAMNDLDLWAKKLSKWIMQAEEARVKAEPAEEA